MESREYQQLMFNLLGNRDYDNFESNELDSLTKKIGYALFGHPKKEDGYDANQNTSIQKLFDVILNESNEFSKHKNRVIVSFVYNCTEPLDSEKTIRAAKYKDYDPKTDVQPLPVFILRKCKYSPQSCRVIVDHLGRVYRSWQEYLERNTLSQCTMTYPKEGRYVGDENGDVILDTMCSPACDLSAKVLIGADVASTGVGIASAGVAIAASIPAITVVGPVALVGAGVAGIGVGIYSIGRSIGALYDKHRHKESLSFSNSAARAAYVNIIAGAVGFIGAGANVAVSQLASQGFNIGKILTIIVLKTRKPGPLLPDRYISSANLPSDEMIKKVPSKRTALRYSVGKKTGTGNPPPKFLKEMPLNGIHRRFKNHYTLRKNFNYNK